MLVITRRVGERIRIGPSVVVTALDSGSAGALLEIVTPLAITLMPEGMTIAPQLPPPAKPGRKGGGADAKVTARRIRADADVPESPSDGRKPVAVVRGVDESVRIGGEIEVMVVSARNDVVKLGVSAPRHVQILREEVYLRIAEETAAAAEAREVGEIPEDLRRLLEAADE